MRKLLKILPIISLLWSCGEQPIVFKNIITNGAGIIMFGTNPSRSFYINENIGDSLVQVWNESTTGSYGNFSPVIFDNYILVADLAGNITSYERKTGLKVGALEFKGEIPVTPVVSNFKIFFVLNELREENSVLYSYDLVHGKILSEHAYNGVSNNEIVFVDEMLYILTTEGVLHKFNDVGYLLGELNTHTLVQSDPASEGDYIYWGNQNGEIISVDKNKLEIKYRKKITSSFEAGITIDKGLGFIGDVDGNVFCLKLSSGEILWEYASKGKIRNHVVFDDKNVYTGNLSGRFSSLNKLNGKKLFEVRIDGLFNATPLVFNDYIIAPDLNREVHFINKATGKIDKSMEFTRRVKMTPIFFDGILYLGADRGQIYALESAKDK